jgi:DNA-binding PadR family transcriptional regulator
MALSLQPPGRRRRSSWDEAPPGAGGRLVAIDRYYIDPYNLRVTAKALKTTWYYILLALASSDRHGLAIAREVLALSDGQLRLWPAMLYGALADLADRGWIEELTDAKRPSSDDSERKRYYRLTRAGRSAAAAETDRLAGLVRVARTRVKPRPGELS